MKKALCFLVALLAAPILAMSYTHDAFVLIRVPQFTGEATYEIVPRDQYAERQKESRMRDAAVKQAYTDVKAEWTEERREKARAAIEKNRNDTRNRRTPQQHDNNRIRTTHRTRTERESFKLGTFPLSEPPSMAIRYLGAFRSAEAAEGQLQKTQAREQMIARRNAGKSQSKLARPKKVDRSRDADDDRNVEALREKMSERTDAVLAELAAGGTIQQGLKAPERKNPIGGSTGLNRSSGGSGTKRLGEGLKGFK